MRCPTAYFYTTPPTHMDPAAIKLELLERLASIRDENVIRQMVELLKKSFPQAMQGDDDFTEEEITELEAQRADHLSGKSASYSADESIRMMREGFNG
jgi:hypothetical protein